MRSRGHRRLAGGVEVEALVPADVVGHADRVERGEDARPVGQHAAPEVGGDRARRDRARAGAARSGGRTPAGRAARCRRPRWSASTRGSTGAPGRPRRRAARGRARRRSAPGVSARQRPPGSHGPTSCQTRMPAASRRASMLSDSGSCERVALAFAARRPATMRPSSAAVSASPWPRASGGSATPRSTSGSPLSCRPPPSQRDLAQADPALQRRLAGHDDAQVVERGAPRRPQPRRVDVRPTPPARATCRRPRRPAPKSSVRTVRPPREMTPRTFTVRDAPRLRTRTPIVDARAARRRGCSRVRTVSAPSSLRPEAHERHGPVQPAVVEPRPRPAGVGLALAGRASRRAPRPCGGRARRATRAVNGS